MTSNVTDITDITVSRDHLTNQAVLTYTRKQVALYSIARDCDSATILSEALMLAGSCEIALDLALTVLWDHDKVRVLMPYLTISELTLLAQRTSAEVERDAKVNRYTTEDRDYMVTEFFGAPPEPYENMTRESYADACRSHRRDRLDLLLEEINSRLGREYYDRSCIN
jgi:hypothetical protein